MPARRHRPGVCCGGSVQWDGEHQSGPGEHARHVGAAQHTLSGRKGRETREKRAKSTRKVEAKVEVPAHVVVVDRVAAGRERSRRRERADPPRRGSGLRGGADHQGALWRTVIPEQPRPFGRGHYWITSRPTQAKYRVLRGLWCAVDGTSGRVSQHDIPGATNPPKYTDRVYPGSLRRETPRLGAPAPPAHHLAPTVAPHNTER